METFFSLPLLRIERLSFVSLNSFLALISIILDNEGNFISLFVKLKSDYKYTIEQINKNARHNGKQTE